jgi:hypothetical protein
MRTLAWIAVAAGLGLASPALAGPAESQKAGGTEAAGAVGGAPSLGGDYAAVASQGSTQRAVAKPVGCEAPATKKPRKKADDQKRKKGRSKTPDPNDDCPGQQDGSRKKNQGQGSQGQGSQGQNSQGQNGQGENGQAENGQGQAGQGQNSQGGGALGGGFGFGGGNFGGGGGGGSRT